jgi:hypothetical protein
MKRKIKAATRHGHAKQVGIAALGGYEQQLAAQGMGCAVCGQPPGVRRLHIDHDHLTGAVRGLLCWTCNATIGRSRDRADRLETASCYLRWGWEVACAHRDAVRTMTLRDHGVI